MDENTDGDSDRFARACGILNNVHTKIIRHILHCQLPPEECADKADKIRIIGSELLNLAKNITSLGNYDGCHILLAYMLLQGCRGIPCPTAGWGATPVIGTTLGDDIQRMFDMKSDILSRRHARSLEKEKYKDLVTMSFDICRNLDSKKVISKIIYAPFPSCVAMLKNFIDSPLDEKDQETYIEEIMKLAQIENDIAKERENFSKMCQVVMDLNPMILQDILDIQLPWANCLTEANKIKIKGRPLRSDQKDMAKNVKTSGYKECDTSLMYIFLRNACPNIPSPSPDWDKEPKGNGIGDDIERIRRMRNRFGHARSATLSTVEYKKELKEVEDICHRFDNRASHSTYTKPNREQYLPKLRIIDSQTMDIEQQEKVLKKLEELNKKEIDIVEAIYDFRGETSQSFKAVNTTLKNINESLGMEINSVIIHTCFATNTCNDEKLIVNVILI